MKGESPGKRFRLGIDLAGGTNMVFQVKPEGKEVNDGSNGRCRQSAN